MTEATPESRIASVAFTGARAELVGIMLRGYALMVPTLGLYRFWQATAKRRFYWQNTVIDGEPLEYTGRASQLLLGFLFALAIFVPVYMALFTLSLQEAQYLAYGYGVLGALLWFFMGYGIYRARDFRLSRTLWRGIRFNLHGNAWAYAARRFLWSIVLVVTGGLAYPWMASSLWRYRWHHTFYGDRRFALAGNWRAFALPYFLAYFGNIGALVAAVALLPRARETIALGGIDIPGPTTMLIALGYALFLLLSLAWYRAASASRMLSTLSLGEAKLTLKLPGWRLFGQYLGYGFAGLVALVLLGVIALVTLGGLLASHGGSAATDSAVLVGVLQSGTLNVVLLIGVYLVVLGLFGLLWETILGFGWWRLLAHAATISGADSIASVKAADEDLSLVGQGLADALNVGAY